MDSSHPPMLAAAELMPVLEILLVCALLALVFCGRVPRLLLWLLGAGSLALFFPGDAVAGWLGNLVCILAGPLLAFGLVVMGLRMMTRGFRPRCRCCGCWPEECRCRRGGW